MSPASSHFILVITCEVDVIITLLNVESKAQRGYATPVVRIQPYLNHRCVGLEQAQIGLYPAESMHVDSTVHLKSISHTFSLPSVPT